MWLRMYQGVRCAMALDRAVSGGAGGLGRLRDEAAAGQSNFISRRDAE